MPREDVLLGALSDFARTLTRRFDISDVLHDLTARVTEVLEVAGAGVSLLEDGQLRFVTALDEATASLERVQEVHQAGPCVEALHRGGPFLVTVLDQMEPRWPQFVERARSVGIASVAGIPMRLEEGSVGVLDLYDTRPRDWNTDDVRVAQVLADMASTYVMTAAELERHERTNAQLQQALDSRVIIEQAKGIIAAERKMSVDQAFEVLRAYARSHNADLRTVAEAVINLGLRP